MEMNNCNGVPWRADKLDEMTLFWREFLVKTVQKQPNFILLSLPLVRIKIFVSKKKNVTLFKLI
jgi:hypothetical protein